MTYGFGMGAGLRALTAAQLGMQTAGNNVANANTPGYSRQRVDLGSALPYGLVGNVQIGTGVSVNGISRMFDDGLERRIQLQLSLVGSATLDEMRYREVESIFGEPDDGLSNQFKDIFGALDQLRTDPADRALRGGFAQAGNTLSQGFRLLSQRLGDLGGSTFNETRGLVRQVNERTATIAKLNEQILSIESNGSVANDLRDSRAQKIRELGELIDVRAIERSSGSIDVLIGGNLAVAGARSTDLRVGKNTAGSTKVMIGGSDTALNLNEGRIAALIRQEASNLPEFTSRVDELARNTILEWNRLHTTGMPGTGPFNSLVSSYGGVDGDGDGVIGDELLSQAGFPFEITSGELYVSVTDEATGEMTRSRIDINPNQMSLESFAAELSAVDHLSASVDPTGRLRVIADAGYGFDFSPRLDPNPDSEGTFGGTAPVIGSQTSGPFDLSGQTFPVSFDVTSGVGGSSTTTTITLDASDFPNTAIVTTDQLVAAINADIGAAGVASNVGGRVMLQSNNSGLGTSLTLSDVGGGSVLGDIGLSTATANGRELAVQVAVEGSYSGLDNQQFTFVPMGDGTIGQTDDLRVRVLDQDGNQVSTLDVGRGYEPGEPIALGNGIRVSFSAGEISRTDGQAFALDALADSDTSDILVATGMNSFFLGSTAGDMTVNPDLLDNPDRIAAGITAASGDAGNLSRLSVLRDLDIDELDGNSIEDFYANIVGDIGFEASSARSALQAQDQLLAQLEADREAISGVNIDEEMVDMLRYQQSYEAAARLISVAQEMTDVLINLGR